MSALVTGLSKISGDENMRMSAAEYLLREGAIKLLVRQIQRKFGFLPETYRKEIETVDSNILIALGDKVLEAKTLQELFGETVLAETKDF